jgi:hypothetical protein
MGKLLVFGAALLLLDVFPGGCSCADTSTTRGPCTNSCQCQGPNAPIKCPGAWECNASKVCEYTCKDLCLDDGGCATAGQACNGSLCLAEPIICR